MNKIRIRAIFKTCGYVKYQKSHNEILYINKNNKHLYLYFERDSYNLNCKLYGREEASKYLLDFLENKIQF